MESVEEVLNRCDKALDNNETFEMIRIQEIFKAKIKSILEKTKPGYFYYFFHNVIAIPK